MYMADKKRKKIVRPLLCILSAAVVAAGIFMKPIKTVLKFVANSILGLLVLLVVNLVGSLWGIHIGLNPFMAIAVGLLGVPGVIAILIAQIFC